MNQTKVQEYLNIANSKRYKTEFEKFKSDIFKYTLKWEGGGKLHKVKGDSGGWTIWGIAYNKNKGLFRDLVDFKDTTYDEAAAIAFVKYYLATRAYMLPKDCKLIYFDMAYNMGNRRAIKLMQKCIGVTADGIIGPVTISKMQNLTKACLYKQRNGFYHLLVKKNRALGKFLKGWLNRSLDIFKRS